MTTDAGYSQLDQYDQDGEHDPIETPAPAPVPPVAGVGLLSRLMLTEPVRLWLYPVLLAVLGLAVAYGLVSDTVAPLWEALFLAVLGVGGRFLVEGVRASVVSPRTAIRAEFDAARVAVAAERERALSITMRAAVAARSLPDVPA